MNMQQSKFTTYLLLSCSMLFWGTSFVFTSLILPSINAISLIFIRLVISASMLWIFILLFYKKCKIEKKDWKYLFLLALFEPFFYFLGETFALERVSPVIVSPIISTIPVFTAIIMVLFFKAKLSKTNIIGIFLSLIGVICMILGKNLQIDVDIFGIFLLFVTVCSSVCYGIILNTLSGKVNTIWLIAIQNTIGMLLFLPLWLITKQPIDYQANLSAGIFANFSPQFVVWFSIIMLSIFSSTLAFMFYSMAVKKIGISRSAVFTNAIPIFTAITAFFLTGELLSLYKMIGILIIIVGVCLTQIEKKEI